MLDTTRRCVLVGAIGLLGGCSGSDSESSPNTEGSLPADNAGESSAPLDPMESGPMDGMSVMSGTDQMQPESTAPDSDADVPVLDDSSLSGPTDSAPVAPDSGATDPDTPETNTPATQTPSMDPPDSGTPDPDASTPEPVENGLNMPDPEVPDQSMTDPDNSGPDSIAPDEDDANNDGTGDSANGNMTQVDFDITVPAYMSNALQVRLNWGENTLSGTWNGDEFWSITASFPTDTENLLTVTFVDENGGITLGSFEADFRTGTNAGEEYRIAANQFDTSRWDEDNDGISNIDELRSSTDPRVDDREGTQVREWRQPPIELQVVAEVSTYYEFLLADERPYRSDIDEVEADPPSRPGSNGSFETTREMIDIDANGNGGVFRFDEFDDIQERQATTREANRSNADGVVTWSGTYERIATGPGHSDERDFTTRTRRIDEQTRMQDGSIVRRASGFGDAEPSFDLTYELSGSVLDGTSSCEPTAGTIVHGGTFRAASENVDAEFRYTKAQNDRFWNVATQTLDGRLLEEYRVESLGISFECNHAELE